MTIYFSLWKTMEESGDKMGISYEPFWQTIGKKQISQYKLLRLGVNNNTLHRLRAGLPITTETVSLLCQLLDCQPNEIMEFTPEDT